MVVITSNMNESAVAFCCNTVNIFPVIISNNVTEVGLELENKIIQIYLSQKKYFDKNMQMKGITMTDCILTRRQQEKKLRFKIMFNPQHNGAARRV